MRNKIIASIFIVAIIGCLVIVLPEKLEANTGSQEKVADSEVKTSTSLSDTNSSGDKAISPYEKINYIDNEVFSVIKNAYANLDYKISFNQGSTETYDLYKSQFKKLLNNEVTFIDNETEEDYYINQYGFFSIDVELGLYDLNKYTYYFFDIDGDERPELCISDKARFTYVIKYNEDLKQFSVWQKYETPTLILMGTKKVAISGNARTGYFLLNKDAEYEQYLWFKVEGYTDSKSKTDNYCFMVTLPQNMSPDTEDTLSESLKNQAMFDEHQQLYYFRVTEEQYNELTKEYIKAVDLSRDAINEVSFTYEELFNEP